MTEEKKPEIDLARIYSVLHFQLRVAERLDAQTQAFEELTGAECVVAHNIIKALDQALQARWEAEGMPNAEALAS